MFLLSLVHFCVLIQCRGPSSSLVQDTCLGRMRSWVQIPAAPPTYVRKSTSFFSFFEYLESPTLGAKNLESNVSLCMGCVFWCGRCSELTLKGKKSINQLASS